MFDFIHRWKDYLIISEAGPIIRRFFVMNAFDGSLTTLGIIIGAWITKGGLTDLSSSIFFSPEIIHFIILTGLATAFSMSISGIWGAYLTETAERIKEIRDLEVAMGKKKGDFDDTLFSKAQHFATIIIAIVDGISPAMAALICLIPFFFSMFSTNPNGIAFPASLIFTLIFLLVLGIFLGRISRKNILVSGLKMLSAGLIIIFLGMILPIGH